MAEDNTVHVTSQKKHLGTACAAFTSGLSTWWSSRPGAVPTAAGVEVIEGAGKLRSADHAFAGCGVGIDHVAFLSLKRLDLSREVLLLRAHARVANPPFSGFRFETHL